MHIYMHIYLHIHIHVHVPESLFNGNIAFLDNV